MRIYFEELEILKGQGKDISFSFSFPEILAENSDVLQFSAVDFVGEARYVAGLVEVTGTAHFEATFPCGRCLQHFSQVYDLPFAERFARVQEATMLKHDEDEIHRIHEDSFDVIPYCKEVINLALPYIPICDIHCKGLCPQCGSNRNDQPCSCQIDTIDPRLADLAKLLNVDED